MSLLNTLHFIVNHPLNKNNKGRALLRFFKWQINSRLNPYPTLYPFAEKSQFIVNKGLTGATGNLYCGLHEYEDMAFVLHFLREGDLFVDIGANVGSYTLLAASEVGSETISVEPVPQTFKTLKANIVLNNIDHITTALNIGMGSEKGMLKFTKSLDTVNHVATEKEKDTIDVQIDKFDNLIKITKPTLLKIDVEGFETEVLKGMGDALKSPNLIAIIIELNGSGNRYGYSENEIHNKLLKHNFKPFCYSPTERKLTETGNFGNHNTIYIKDINLTQQRVKTAKKFKILGQDI